MDLQALYLSLQLAGWIVRKRSNYYPPTGLTPDSTWLLFTGWIWR